MPDTSLPPGDPRIALRATLAHLADAVAGLRETALSLHEGVAIADARAIRAEAQALRLALDPAAEIAGIVEVVAAEFDVTPQIILGLRSDQEAVRARRAVMQIAHARGHTASAIGRALGRDHTTVLYGLQQVAGVLGEGAGQSGRAG